MITTDNQRSRAGLTYFERVLERRRAADPLALAAFARHVHFGYWEDPSRADGSIADYVRAADALTRRIIAAAAIQSGQRILDVGCGIGGTLAMLNEQYANVDLIGLNIDPAQIDHARVVAGAWHGNQVTFSAGDAMRLPFADQSCDAMLAVECSFHFSSRRRFLREAYRVLRPGGRLALSDFVTPWPMYAALWMMGGAIERAIAPAFGPFDLSYTLNAYLKIARQVGFTPVVVDDITTGMLPTFPIWRKLIQQLLPDHAGMADLFTIFGWFHRMRLMRYMILAFEK